MKNTSNQHLTKFFICYTIISPILFILITFILGFISPDYNTLEHTISRLLILSYGKIQQINFFQFAISFVLTGHLLSLTLKDESFIKMIKNSSYFCFSVLVLAAIFKPENIDNFFVNFDKLSSNTISHIVVILIFIFISPFGINNLFRNFKKELAYKNLALFTAIFGYCSLAMSIIWIIFYYEGLFFDYKGIFEKIIAIWVIVWVEAINYRVIRNLKS